MELGHIIASRRFELGDKTVELLLGAPVSDDDGENYFCPFEVKGLGNEKVRRIGGVDSLQALILGISCAAAYLSTRPEAESGELTFLGGSGIGIGFGTWPQIT